MRFLRLCSMLFIFSAVEGGSATFHVSPRGSDDNSGTERKPFATLTRARDAIRQMKFRKMREPIRVIVHGGNYPLTNQLALAMEDSGTVRHPIVWQAAEGDEVRIMGGPEFSADSFRLIAEENVLARLDPAARGKVFQLKLATVGAPALPEFPKNFRGVPAVPELFFNEQRMTIARWPNQGWATISRIIESGSVPREGDQSGRPGTFEYSGAQPDRWKAEQGVWLQGYWCYDWYDETIQVKSIDREKRQITLETPALYGVKQGNPSPRRFRALNLLEELDEPGEFYIDRESSTLYFLPPAEMKGARVALSTLNEPLLSLSNAAHITFQGFIFEGSLGNGVEVTGGRSNRLENCVVRNTRQLGIVVRGGDNHVVERCEIHDTGTGGLILEGGDRKTLTSAHHEALNNHIWGFSRHQLTAAYGLTLGGVGNRAVHNVVHDAPHQAIFINGNDHLFEFNVVSNVVMETDDAGALYKGRNPSCRGNIIRYNFWKDIGSPMGHGTAAIYFDDGDGGDLVFGNIFQRCGHPGGGTFGTVFSHGGHDIRAENNIFIDCRRAFGSAPWGDQLWKETIDGGHDCHFQPKLLQEVDITKPPYTTRYPELIGFMKPQPGQPRNSFAKNNVFIRSPEASTGNWISAANETWRTESDAGFVDAKGGNFALRPDAEVFQRLTNFKSIPFEKIGFQSGSKPDRAKLR